MKGNQQIIDVLNQVLTAELTAERTAVRTAEPSTPALGTRHSALTADAGAWARLTYICPGADRSVVDDANGKLVLRTVLEDFDDRVVLWGDALDCIVDPDTDDGLATLDAAVLAHYIVEDDALYVGLDGALRLPADDRPFTLDFVQDIDGTRLYRVVDAGSFVIGLDGLGSSSLDGGGAVTVRDRDGVWRCTYQADAVSGRCVRDGEVLRWP